MKTSVLFPAGQIVSLAAAFLLTIGCEGDPGRQGAPGPEGQQGPQGEQGDPGLSGDLDPSLSTWDKVVIGIGGQAALDGLTGFSIDASGMRRLSGESLSHDDPELPVDMFDLSTHMDMASDGLRLDWSRSLLFFGGVPLNYSEIISADLGYVEGNDNVFGEALQTTDMPSGRWAAVRKQTMLLNPHGLLAMVSADPSMASDGGVALFNGAVHELLVIQDAVYPITLYVNASTGRIAKLSTAENDFLYRDIPIEVHFHDWMDDDNGGVAFPMSVFLTVNGQIWHEEYRNSVTQNPTFTTEFDFPVGADPMYDADIAMWGMQSHQFQQGFLSLGLPHGAPQLAVVPTMLANGVYFLGGSGHNSMAIEQQTGVVILEAPLYPERSEAILAWVETTFGKPVTHVVVTHHHFDHSAGFRAFVAAGATILVGAESAEFLAELAQRPSTIVPDTQQTAPMQPNIIAIPVGDSYTIANSAPFAPGRGDAQEKGVFADVMVYGMTSGHAGDMLIAQVQAGAGYIFESDMFNPDGMGGSALSPVYAQELLDAINMSGWNVPGATLVGGHAAYAPLTELENYLATP